MDEVSKRNLFWLVGIFYNSLTGYIFWRFLDEVAAMFETWMLNLEGLFAVSMFVSGLALIGVLIGLWKKTPHLYTDLSFVTIHFIQRNGTPDEPTNPTYILDSRADKRIAYSVISLPSWLVHSVTNGKFVCVPHDSETALKAEFIQQGITIEEKQEPTPRMLGIRCRTNNSLFIHEKPLDEKQLSVLKSKKIDNIKIVYLHPWLRKEVSPPAKRLLIKQCSPTQYEVYEGIAHDLELTDNEILGFQSYSIFPWEFSIRFWCWRYPHLSFHRHAKYIKWHYSLSQLEKDY
ncbi:MAG: hypothetical protein NWE92_09815 [Candidatus Bathyarchaeota archaeon]|nr:hypothetical protein [Candidatus Bathyarchaeota archaeon]